MNKSSVKQKRSVGKNCPLSKRPKLDFTLKTGSSFKESVDGGKGSPNACQKVMKEKCAGNSSQTERDQHFSTSDWDDDFSGDMLERVCLIADLSQAMVNNQPIPDQEKEKSDLLKERISPECRPSFASVDTEASYDILKFEFEKLQEKLKTKEGEVHILRSQLKQNEDAKQAAALQNIKLIEEIQEKYNDKLNLTEKELESTKSKLLFRDLEYKTLSERCRQLEYGLSRSKLAETQGTAKQFNRLSQGPESNLCSAEISFEQNNLKLLKSNNHSNRDKFVKFHYFIPVHHEGKNLAKILCPEFFKCADEPSVVAFYFHCSEAESHQTKLIRADKYKWYDLPKQTIHIKDLYKDVTSLFTCENFTQKEGREIIQTIFLACEQILHHQNEVFKFLDKLKFRNIEYEKADRCLLEKEEKIGVVTIKNVLKIEKLNEEECGVELRRSLGLIYSLIHVSKTAFDIVKTNLKWMRLFKDIAASIGRLRTPLRYTGVLVGISFILQELLEDKHLGKEILTLITDTIEEIIFSRPQLNVLREVINALAAGKHHANLLAALCRRESVDSCMLYMDCKLKQAMFFTKNACPLKLLCMQIMGLACLPCNQTIRWDVTDCIIKWLNSSLSTENSKNLKWLPVHASFMEEEKCFNVIECLLYLLVLCLNDYNLIFLLQDNFDCSTIMRKIENEKKKASWISIIGRGAVLFKRILKVDQRQLHEGSYSLRFSVMLKALMANKQQVNRILSSVELDALSWVNDLLESDLRMQDCCLKQSTSAIADIDVFHALKINDESKII